MMILMTLKVASQQSLVQQRAVLEGEGQDHRRGKSVEEAPDSPEVRQGDFEATQTNGYAGEACR